MTTLKIGDAAPVFNCLDEKGNSISLDNYKGKKFAWGSSARSKTFLGIARAMATQWTTGDI